MRTCHLADVSIIPNIDIYCSVGSPLHHYFVPLCVPILVCLTAIYRSIKNGYFHLLIHWDIIPERAAPFYQWNFEKPTCHNRFLLSYGFEIIFKSNPLKAYATVDWHLFFKLVKTLHTDLPGVIIRQNRWCLEISQIRIYRSRWLSKTIYPFGKITNYPVVIVAIRKRKLFEYLLEKVSRVDEQRTLLSSSTHTHTIERFC